MALFTNTGALMNPIDMLRGQVGQLWSDDPAVQQKKGGGGINGLQALLGDVSGAGIGAMIQNAISGLLGSVSGFLGGLFGGGGGGGGIGGAIGSLFGMANCGNSGPGSLIGDLGSFAENDDRMMG